VFWWVLRGVGVPGLLVAYGSCSWTVKLSSERFLFQRRIFLIIIFFVGGWLVAFILVRFRLVRFRLGFYCGFNVPV
jgi:hypothetical protein